MFFTLLCVIFSLPCSLSSSAISRLSLFNNQWTITDHQNYSASSFLPGTIHTILLRSKLIPEPYVGFNDDLLRPLIHSYWSFATNFSLTSQFLQWKQFTLHFEQIDTVADITLNRCFLGRTISMFIPYAFPVDRSCLKEENTIEIHFISAVTYAANQAAAYFEVVEPECPATAQHGECHSQFIRKESSSFSWDWGPAFAPIGIPGEVYLEGRNPTDLQIRLESVNVAHFNSSNNRWRVDILLSSSNDLFRAELKFLLQNSSFAEQRNVTISSNVSLSLFIPDEHVQLWWPNGYGDPILYNFSIYHRNELIGWRQIGFRTVHLIQHDYGPTINGSSFYFLINYRAIFIKGSNWVPPDAFQERVTDDQFERLLRSAQLANMNMLRISGVGLYERESFYALADRFGLMIWHDLMFGCSLYPMDDEFLDQVTREILYQIKRLQSHPSIVLWAANNENEVALAENWYDVPPAKMDRRKDEYRRLYVDIIMKAVQEVDQGTNRPFIVSSPSNGLESIEENYIATDPNDSRYGDVHFYGYHEDSWDPQAYPITRFLTETGIQSLPSLDTWSSVITQPSDLSMESDFLLHREHSGGQIGAMIKHIQSNLPVPITKDPIKNFTQWIYLSQINQAMTLKSVSDFCRFHSPADQLDPKTGEGNTMGFLYWQINDIWQAPTWATIDYDLRWKMAHYYARAMFAPVYPLILLRPYLANRTDEQARISVYMINEYLDDSQGVLTCSIRSLDDFTVRLSFTYQVTYDLSITQHIADLPFASILERANCRSSSDCLMHCAYTDEKRSLEQTLFFTRPKLYTLRQPNLKIESVEQESATDWKITITASHPALFVWLDSPSANKGHFSDNGFHLFAPRVMIHFHSWTPIDHLDLRISSLFDLTQP